MRLSKICCQLFFVAMLCTLLLRPIDVVGAETLYMKSQKALEAAAAIADSSDWCFIFLGDSHGNDEKLKEMLEATVKIKPLFILHGGDVSHRGSAEEFTSFLKMAGSVKDLPPLFVIRGNHESDPVLFERMLGPLDFVLDSSRLGLRLVAIDNSNYAVGSDALKLLSKQLDRSRPYQFVAMHIPPATERWSRHSFEKGKSELLDLLVSRKVRFGLFAHTHLFDKDEYRGVPLLISAGAGSQLAWFGYPGEAVYHMVVVEVKKGLVSYRVVRFATTLMP